MPRPSIGARKEATRTLQTRLYESDIVRVRVRAAQLGETVAEFIRRAIGERLTATNRRKKKR